jgi:hypothetical protein
MADLNAYLSSKASDGFINETSRPSTILGLLILFCCYIRMPFAWIDDEQVHGVKDTILNDIKYWRADRFLKVKEWITDGIESASL